VEKRRFLENCTACGLCAEVCPIIPYTEIGEVSAQEIQEDVLDFMTGASPNPKVFAKAFACMECFKCTAGMCPEGLNPMLVNEIIKGKYISSGLADNPCEDAMRADSIHRVLASVQVSALDYRRITRADKKRKARYVFFPGCNVYFQPDKILSALDILDAVGDDCAFLPGLDYCCGDSLFFAGDIAGAGRRAETLVAALCDYEPEAVIFWCPTCQCRFEMVVASALTLPFKVLSFPQYLAGNMDRLSLSDAAAGTVTLHDPCKSVYTEADLSGPRQVLQQLPGVTLREMAHHGKQTTCCGSGAGTWFQESCARFREERLEEAARTGADYLITVCHYCGQSFAAEEKRYHFSVSNYVQRVAAAMGIERDDCFKRYLHWRNLDRILNDAGDRIRESPFAKERIIEVLKSVFVN
jgi:Fe-S oxidoreductase